jgi:predicted phosphodiesterase
MATLVVSDLHLGMASRQDVVRRPEGLAALLDAVAAADRVVLLGDVVELLEGRPALALDDAEPVLREIGAAAGRGKELLIVPGNHDFGVVRPWLAARSRRGVRLGLSSPVGRESTPWLTRIGRALRPARVGVRYPGVWLADGVYATHGHYLDRHLTPDLVRRAVSPRYARVFGDVPERATPGDYERAGGANFAALTGLLASEVPGPVGEAIDRVAGRARRAALSAMPRATSMLGMAGIALAGSDTIATALRRAGLAAMSEVVARLGVDASHVVFGHTHRAGPFPDDDATEWVSRTGVELVNTGSWVHDEFLLEGVEHDDPWWPGRAVELGADGVPRVRTLLGEP